MPKIVLDRARILAIIGKLVAAAVPQHVAMHEEAKSRSLPRPGNHALVAGHAQRRAAL